VKKFVWGIVLVILAMSFMATAESLVTAKFAAKAPKIDGVLNDEVWSKAEAIADFTNAETGSKPSGKTEYWVAWDNDNLYVAIKNYVNTEYLRQTVTTDEGPTWDDDENSVFLNPSLPEMAGMYQYSFNSLGIKNGLGYGGATRPGLDQWEVAIKIEKDYYAAEICISFESAETWPSAGDEWGFNVGRNCTSLGELYSWSPLGGGKFVDPTTFGVIRFVK